MVKPQILAIRSSPSLGFFRARPGVVKRHGLIKCLKHSLEIKSLSCLSQTAGGEEKHPVTSDLFVVSCPVANDRFLFLVAAYVQPRFPVNIAEPAAAVLLDEIAVETTHDPEELLALSEALNRLEAADPQAAEVVKLRFFAGLTVEETAELLEISPATVKRDWTLAKIWLRR